VYESPGLEKIKERVREQLEALHESVKRFRNPHGYPVGLEKRLHQRKMDMIRELRKK
jgi:nicotinate phosphoribosyltransferase